MSKRLVFGLYVVAAHSMCPLVATPGAFSGAPTMQSAILVTSQKKPGADAGAGRG